MISTPYEIFELIRLKDSSIGSIKWGPIFEKKASLPTEQAGDAKMSDTATPADDVKQIMMMIVIKKWIKWSNMATKPKVLMKITHSYKT